MHRLLYLHFVSCQCKEETHDETSGVTYGNCMKPLLMRKSWRKNDTADILFDFFERYEHFYL